MTANPPLPRAKFIMSAGEMPPHRNPAEIAQWVHSVRQSRAQSGRLMQWYPKAGRTTRTGPNPHVGPVASDPDDFCTQQHDVAGVTREVVGHYLPLAQ